ncbi:hypothetical protein SUGI_0403520 [Cryptomeria japonica]|nr:hypothetical protein SUGI_0403520 [Cryptomeria japonica]
MAISPDSAARDAGSKTFKQVVEGKFAIPESTKFLIREDQQGDDKDGGGRRGGINACFLCKREGHIRKNCPLIKKHVKTDTPSIPLSNSILPPFAPVSGGPPPPSNLLSPSPSPSGPNPGSLGSPSVAESVIPSTPLQISNGDSPVIEKLDALSAKIKRATRSKHCSLPPPTPLAGATEPSKKAKLNAQQIILEKFKKLNETRNRVQQIVNSGMVIKGACSPNEQETPSIMKDNPPKSCLPTPCDSHSTIVKEGFDVQPSGCIKEASSKKAKPKKREADKKSKNDIMDSPHHASGTPPFSYGLRANGGEEVPPLSIGPSIEEVTSDSMEVDMGSAGLKMRRRKRLSPLRGTKVKTLLMRQ